MNSAARTDKPDRLLTVDQVAEYLGVSRTTVRKLIAERRIETYRVGRRIRIHPDAVEDYLYQNRHARQA